MKLLAPKQNIDMPQIAAALAEWSDATRTSQVECR